MPGAPGLGTEGAGLAPEHTIRSPGRCEQACQRPVPGEPAGAARGDTRLARLLLRSCLAIVAA